MKVELNNTTRKLCVIGDPVLHSRSPLLQNAMCQALGLDYIYLCQPVARGETETWTRYAAFAGYAGFNATMPHKEALVPLMDELDPLSKRCGAVNTVCVRDGKLYGYNTDGAGFLRALAGAGVSPPGMRVLLLGAGGAAKAVTAALTESGATVTVCNRTLEKAERLCALAPDRARAAGFCPETLRALAEETDLLINCTCLGMSGTGTQFSDLSFLDRLPRGAVICDAVYEPEETELLKKARALGHLALNGMGMLVWQAVLALERFTGLNFDEEKAARAAMKALKN